MIVNDLKGKKNSWKSNIFFFTKKVIFYQATRLAPLALPYKMVVNVNNYKCNQSNVLKPLESFGCVYGVDPTQSTDSDINQQEYFCIQFFSKKTGMFHSI